MAFITDWWGNIIMVLSSCHVAVKPSTCFQYLRSHRYVYLLCGVEKNDVLPYHIHSSHHHEDIVGDIDNQKENDFLPNNVLS